MKVSLKSIREDGVRGGIMRIVVDGYNAPVTAGNWVDLVDKHFYDGLTVQRADGFIVQTGDPDGPVWPLLLHTPRVMGFPHPLPC
jgi:cyclophilin family peptidyl-prolyl cis-trans isomerase